MKVKLLINGYQANSSRINVKYLGLTTKTNQSNLKANDIKLSSNELKVTASKMIEATNEF